MGSDLIADFGGLKCDNPSCDYQDLSIKVEDYKSHINAPCPKCSAPLLTQADYDKVQEIFQMVAMINSMPMDDMPESDGRQAKVTFEFNGTGEVEMKIEEVLGEEK